MNQIQPIHTQTPDDGLIFDDLLDAVWTEDIGEFRTKVLAAANGQRAVVTISKAELTISLSRETWRDEDRPCSVNYADTGMPVHSSEFLWLVLTSLPDLDLYILDRSMKQLADALRNQLLFDGLASRIEDATQAMGSIGNALLWEQLTAWKDRPFHPYSRSRGNWTKHDVKRYGAEEGALFALRWCAIDASHVLPSPKARQVGPAPSILSDTQLTILNEEMVSRSIAASHIALPVHPWHADHVLKHKFANELDDKKIIALDFQGPLVAATSSLRTVVSPATPSRHIKLPLGVETLGVRRLLSAQSLHNGLKGAEVLSAALKLRPSLGRVAQIADETQFWTFTESSKDILAERTAYLGCVIRDIPISDNSSLMPLAAFAVLTKDQIPFAFRAILDCHPELMLEDILWDLFDLLIGFAIEALGCGFIPEMHGQNVLVELTNGRPTGIILRDHDTVRCLPAVLAENCLPVPDYIIKDPKRATMLLSRCEDLFAYGQTLLFDVAFRAICRALEKAGAIDMINTRQKLRRLTQRHISDRQMPTMLRKNMRAAFLEQQQWPFKEILRPLLNTGQLGLGMPSRLGNATNPLRQKM